MQPPSHPPGRTRRRNTQEHSRNHQDPNSRSHHNQHQQRLSRGQQPKQQKQQQQQQQQHHQQNPQQNSQQNSQHQSNAAQFLPQQRQPISRVHAPPQSAANASSQSLSHHSQSETFHVAPHVHHVSSPPVAPSQFHSRSRLFPPTQPPERTIAAFEQHISHSPPIHLSASSPFLDPAVRFHQQPLSDQSQSSALFQSAISQPVLFSSNSQQHQQPSTQPTDISLDEHSLHPNSKLWQQFMYSQQTIREPCTIDSDKISIERFDVPSNIACPVAQTVVVSKAEPHFDFDPVPSRNSLPTALQETPFVNRSGDIEASQPAGVCKAASDVAFPADASDSHAVGVRLQPASTGSTEAPPLDVAVDSSSMELLNVSSGNTQQAHTPQAHPKMLAPDLQACDSHQDREGRRRSRSGASSSCRRKTVRWDKDEVQALLEGVMNEGVGKWAAILKASKAFNPVRTSVDLKDKWRNLPAPVRNQALATRMSSGDASDMEDAVESVSVRVDAAGDRKSDADELSASDRACDYDEEDDIHSVENKVDATVTLGFHKIESDTSRPTPANSFDDVNTSPTKRRRKQRAVIYRTALGGSNMDSLHLDFNLGLSHSMSSSQFEQTVLHQSGNLSKSLPEATLQSDTPSASRGFVDDSNASSIARQCMDAQFNTDIGMSQEWHHQSASPTKAGTPPPGVFGDTSSVTPPFGDQVMLARQGSRFTQGESIIADLQAVASVDHIPIESVAVSDVPGEVDDNGFFGNACYVTKAGLREDTDELDLDGPPISDFAG